MARTKANKPTKAAPTEKPAEPKTVAEAKKREEGPGYWRLTDDEVLLRSPDPEDEYKTSDSWRVFRIMGEFVGGFDELFEALTLIQTRKIRNFPVVLFDSQYWRGLLAWLTSTMLNEKMLNAEDLTLIHLTDSPKGAVDFIKKIFHSEVEIPKQKPKR